MDFQTGNKGLKIERAARCTEYEAPQVDLWFVVPNGVSECLGVSCFLFVCFTVKKCYHFHAVSSRCHNLWKI